MNIPKIVLRLLLGKRLPVTSGTLKVPGASQSITIYRDRYGIPHIEAGTEIDAYYALGFCQGQDRAFQLEMLLRVNHGTLSELIGEDGLPIDRLSRRIGFYRYAKGHYSLLKPGLKSMIDAFANGINEGVNYGCQKFPHGFALLRANPTPWKGVDILAGGNYIAFGLSAWSAKLTRLILLHKDGPQAIKALDPDYADWLPVTSPVASLAGASIDRLSEDLALLTSIYGLEGNSNNWAMNSRRTSTGRPILANDPHLWPSLPTQWYLAHIETPNMKVAGASFLGAPNIPSGHNQYAAWGVTATLADNIDLFIEQFGEDGVSVKEEEAWASCETLHETYMIKGKEPFEEDILVTPRGPIISDVLEGDFGTSTTQAIALRATWMSPQSVEGLITLHHARDFASFRAAASNSRFVSQNFVYADIHDNIGWQFTCDVPQRGEGRGILPLPGWDARYHWKEDSTPWDKMPTLLNPEANFLATANDKPTADDGGGSYLGRDFIEYRHARIVELLAERSDWDIESTLRMQIDQFSIPWSEMKAIVLSTPVGSDDARLAQELLKDWDGILYYDSAAAAVYEFFVISMLQRMAGVKAPNSAEYALDKGFHPLVLRSMFGLRPVSNLVRLLNSQPEDWFEKGWSAEIADALAQAVHELRYKQGDDHKTWSWGAVHGLVLTHPLGIRPPLDKVFNRGPYPTGGDHDTVAQAGRTADEFGSNVTGLANLRAVHDVGNWDECRYVIAGGQSGNPFSPHYDDLLEYWLRGEMVRMAWSKETVKRAAVQTLQLQPAK